MALPAQAQDVQRGTTGPEWHEMVQACEAVILQQSFGALDGDEGAPFSVGMPGIRELAVHNGKRTLVAIARSGRDIRASCTVRETIEKDRARWRVLMDMWNEGLEAGFSRRHNRAVRWSPVENMVIFGAMRCRNGRLVLRTAPHFLPEFRFRVSVLPNPENLDASGCGVTDPA